MASLALQARAACFMSYQFYVLLQEQLILSIYDIINYDI